ncbi:ragA, partial [Symbiodinium necroappetens]
IVLFEKNTFLVISDAGTKAIQDCCRFEKLSNIIKRFKLSCQKAKTNFHNFEVKNDKFRATMEPFLSHSYIMVVVSDLTITSSAISANLWAMASGRHGTCSHKSSQTATKRRSALQAKTFLPPSAGFRFSQNCDVPRHA